MKDRLTVYGAALEAANAAYAAAVARVGGYLGASEAQFQQVILPAGRVWDLEVAAAYAAQEAA